mmetsp:Transcript_16378/g.36161  ORF Transcript_16378/g.36161 Transcript_16378/m.36161 type:complete len:218 (-) Transcript_16378:1634-2287(-)
MDIATKFADEPMILPIPPTHAPRDSAQASGITGIPRESSFLKLIRMYATVVVKGNDSRKAEPKPATHNITKHATSMRASIGTEVNRSVNASPSARIKPISPRDSTKTNKVAKNIKVSHSTASKKSRKLWCECTIQEHIAPNMVNHAASCPCTGDRNKANMIPPKMMATNRNSRWSRMGFSSANFTRSICCVVFSCSRIRIHMNVTATGNNTTTTGAL